ncbi:PAS domain S-box protein [Sulfurimonas aquatica]|uniref:histidine kinase n=1 Tax=Sulfurimonas aquatica TaxID=2672570 RepID=A0A975B2G3_9BACT|nr:PAS domain S-box protein [Sulfurimonas aquatica]QSZ43009.1 PAS domain S-box protein [Sulfurimonas aquatica]
MKQLNLTSLRAQYIRYTIMALFIVTLMLSLFIYLFFEDRINTIISQENEKLHTSMLNIQNVFLKRHDYLSRRILTMHHTQNYIVTKQRDKLYDSLKERWELFQEENYYFSVLHFHLADGSSFLRLNKPDKYGDKMPMSREMIEEVHKNHKKIIGYESACNSIAQRIITPIFDQNSTYLGALELGLNPNYLVERFKKFLGYDALLFVSNESLESYRGPRSEYIFDEYTLMSDIDSKMQKYLERLVEKRYDFSNNYVLDIDGKMFYLHKLPLKDYKGEVKAEIVAFQDLSAFYTQRNNMLMIVVSTIILILGFILIYTYFSTKKVQKYLEKLYESYLNKLKESKEKFEHLFMSAPQAYQSLDKDGHILMVNRRWMREFAYEEKEVIGRDFKDFLTPKSQEVFGKCFRELQSKGLIEDIELEVLRENAKIVIINLDIEATYSKDNKLLQAQCLFENITEKKRQHELLRFNEEYLKLVFDSMPDPVFTTNGAVIDRVNLELLKITKYESIEAFKKEHDCFCDYFVNEEGYVHTQMDGINWLEYIYANPSIQHRVKINIDEEKIYTLKAQKLKLDENERSLVVFDDITQIEEAGVELQRSHEFTKKIINSIDNLIFVKDKEFNYLACNLAFEKLLGRTQEQIIGHKDNDFFDKEIAQRFHDNDKDIFSKKEATSHFEWVKYPNEEKAYMLVVKSPLRAENGEIMGVVGSLTDFTKEKKLEDELHKQEEIMLSQSRHAAMGEMIGMIAHQWRQPISTIAMGANNIIVDTALGTINDASLEKFATEILEQTQHLSKTIDDFRDFFKPNKKREDTQFSLVLEEALSIIGSSLVNHNVEVIKEIKSQLIISTYSRELLQVYINLIKNAKEALLENEIKDAKIFITIREDEQDIITEICDNAGGVEPELLEKIFEPYFTTKDERNGTGLGLYMSQTIVEKHLGGTLSVKNTKEGACFSVRVPKIAKEELKEESR